jgi:hypothetical protein
MHFRVGWYGKNSDAVFPFLTFRTYTNSASPSWLMSLQGAYSTMHPKETGDSIWETQRWSGKGRQLPFVKHLGNFWKCHSFSFCLFCFPLTLQYPLVKVIYHFCALAHVLLTLATPFLFICTLSSPLAEIIFLYMAMVFFSQITLQSHCNKVTLLCSGCFR